MCHKNKDMFHNLAPYFTQKTNNVLTMNFVPYSPHNLATLTLINPNNCYLVLLPPPVSVQTVIYIGRFCRFSGNLHPTTQHTNTATLIICLKGKIQMLPFISNNCQMV